MVDGASRPASPPHPSSPPHLASLPDLASLPTLVVIGAMKCGTSALHRLLDRHPDVAMAPGKEVNFFFGPERAPDTDPATWWRDGHWHRGPQWYASLFDPTAPVRGEASPGYTDPAHPEVPARLAGLLPDVRLVYLVREPAERAVSQWRHHRRDGTEPRPVEEAVLDPASQYLDRSRYHARVAPYLEHLDPEQLLVVAQEDLRDDPVGTMRQVLEHAGADPDRWPTRTREDGVTGTPTEVPDGVRAAVWEQVADDADRLADLAGRDLLRR